MDTMHLSELSHHVDHAVGKFLTNQQHLASRETLGRLVMGLTKYTKQ